MMKVSHFSTMLHSTTTFFFFILILAILFPLTGMGQPFQRNFGNTLDNGFTKVIQDGTNYYVLGSTEPATGATRQATVTRLDANGMHQWTLSLTIPSVWNDAVITPDGKLIMVGSTLPFDPTAQGIMGKVNSSGAFEWLKQQNITGRDALNRIVYNPVPENPMFPYYVLGTQFEPGGTPTTEDVILHTMNDNGTWGWKKIFPGAGDNEFSRDLEVLPGSGDLILAGNNAAGLIYRADNTGNVFNGVQIGGIYFNDVAQRSAGGFYASANSLTGTEAFVFKFDQDFLVQWQIKIPQLTLVRQVWEGASGSIFVTGDGFFGGDFRTVIIKLADNGPTVTWVKYLNAGSNFANGSLWYLLSGNMAYTDERILPIPFGGTCAYISVSDLELNTCLVSQDMVSLIFFDPFPDGPPLPSIEFQDVPMEINLIETASLNWLEAEVCSNAPCEASFDITLLDACGLAQITGTSTGPGPFDYLWCDASTSASFTTQLECGENTFCVSVTCEDGTVSTATQTINFSENIPPVALCVPGFGVELDPDCTYTLTPQQIDAGSTDNCFIKKLEISPSVLTGCGDHVITLTVTDWCDNTSTCTTGVQTIEVMPPTIMCPPNLTINCNESTDPAQTGFATATDNCTASPTITYTDITFGSFPCDGVIQRTWTATDECGNESSCIQNIVVMDNVPPTANCNSSVTVVLDANCMASISAADIDENSFDNCQIASMSVSPSTFNHCGEFQVTLTVTDVCGLQGTCTSVVTVIDGIAPMVTCPQDVTVTAFLPDCEAVVNNIYILSASDNCSIASIAYDITGATTLSGTGDASGQTFQQGTSTVTYTVTDDCGNTASCSFDVIVECVQCTCNGFANLSFYNLGVPDVAVSCNQPTVELPCIPNDGLYWFKGDLLCSADCPSTIDYEIVSVNGGPAILSGSVFGGIQVPILNFGAAQIGGPGNYQLILTGNCGGDICTCVINFTVPECCDCGEFSEMSFRPTQGVMNLPISCGDTMGILCNQAFSPQVSGLFQCQGPQCPAVNNINWTLSEPGGPVTQSGLINGPNFNFSLTPAWFNTPGIYTLTFTGSCGGQYCPPCVLYFESEGCNCCTDQEAFLQAVANFQANAQFGNCSINVNGTGLNDCLQVTWDWGDGSPLEGPYSNNTPVSHSYTGTPAPPYTVCYTIQEFNAGEVCWEITVCLDEQVFCDTCSCGELSDLTWRPSQGAPNIPIECGDSLTLGCLNPGANVMFEGHFDCIGDDCPPPLVNWVLREKGTQLFVGAGTVSGSNFQIPLPASYFTFPKVYELFIIGECNGVLCQECMFMIMTTECPCECGEFTEMSFRPTQGSMNIPINCGDTMGILCNQAFPPEISGFFQCLGPDCPPENTLTWTLNEPAGPVTQSGTTNGPNFTINLTPAWFNNPGIYSLTITGNCGGQACPPCILYFESAGCGCCVDEEAFFANVQNAVSVSVDNAMCKATVNIGDLGDCNDYLDYIDWGDNQVYLGPFTSGAMPMHVYPGSGVYQICYKAIEKDANGAICFDSTFCKTIDIACSIQQDTCVLAPDGLVGWWPMDDLWGDPNVIDISGGLHHGIPEPNGSSGLPNGPEPVAGKVDGALDFVSVPGTSWVTVNNHNDFQFGGGSFSIDAWIKTDMGTQTEPIVSKINYLTNTGYALSIQGSSPYYLTLEIGTGSMVEYLQGPAITPGIWNFVAVSVLPQNWVTFYVGNASSGGVLSQISLPIGVTDAANTLPLLIGKNPSNPHWNITIDELEIFNHALYPWEFNTIWQAGALGKCKPACLCDDLDTNVEAGYTVRRLSEISTTYLFHPTGLLDDCDSVTWLWGDESIESHSTGREVVEHVFPDSGSWNVSLIVNRLDDNGASCTASFAESFNATDFPDFTNSVHLFPNPTNGHLTLRFDGPMPGKGQWQVIDLWGRVVGMGALEPNKPQHQLNIDLLPAGLYLVKVLDDGVPVWIEKVIKQ